MNSELKAYVVFSKVHSNPKVKAVRDTRKLIGNLERFHVLDSKTVTRVSYSDSIAAGASAAEMGDKKAAIEIENLVKEVFS
jgi:carbon monoxide dehydrogenase subunit G